MYFDKTTLIFSYLQFVAFFCKFDSLQEFFFPLFVCDGNSRMKKIIYISVFNDFGYTTLHVLW